MFGRRVQAVLLVHLLVACAGGGEMARPAPQPTRPVSPSAPISTQSSWPKCCVPVRGASREERKPVSAIEVDEHLAGRGFVGFVRHDEPFVCSDSTPCVEIGGEVVVRYTDGTAEHFRILNLERD